MPQKDITLKDYLLERKSELHRKYPIGTNAGKVVDLGFDFITTAFVGQFSRVCPRNVRRAELLESLLVSFVEHVLDSGLLTEMEKEMGGMKEA